MYSLDQIADMLESAPRVAGKPANVGQTEGPPKLSRCIVISDAMAKAMAASLRMSARGEAPNAVSVIRR